MYYENKLLVFNLLGEMQNKIEKILEEKCNLLMEIKFSVNLETI
jgi:hypothetical protein